MPASTLGPELPEFVTLHCRCGASFVAPVHPSVQERFTRAWQQAHAGPEHGAITEPVGGPEPADLVVAYAKEVLA